MNQSYKKAQDDFLQWQQATQSQLLNENSCLMHTYQFYFSEDQNYIQQLKKFATVVSQKLEAVVAENNKDANLPQLQQYNGIGQRVDEVEHHPSYVEAGNLIYGSGLMAYLRSPGEMKKTLGLFLLSSHAGEAGHNCPIACSAGLIRVLLNYGKDLKETPEYLEKLIAPSFEDNYTGAQFLTEIQGGSDVGANASVAYQDKKGGWRIRGEKWFCSNANADLILMTARFDEKTPGTKGLGLFLIPQSFEGNRNHYTIRRLKQKIGTRSMATAEIDFNDAVAFPMGSVKEGIHLVMENVLHLSRVFNAFSVLGMARRAYQIAYHYARHRQAFSKSIYDFPLIQERLASIKAQNVAMTAAVFRMAALQDQVDSEPNSDELKLLLRVLANINKYYTAKNTVENVHHCLDILAGNGTIESFSPMPRLLRDSIVCENWEGTHFVLWMQTLKDIQKFKVDAIFCKHIADEINLCYQEKTRESLNSMNAGLQQKFLKLKTYAQDEQSLYIGAIVADMASLYAATALAIEVQDNKAPKDKKAALELFFKILNPSESQGKNIALYKAVLNNIR